ncbi:hypothetical protein [Asticcacaulis solisilvae]|uniref:hypothetical protein n=1 Tax=Asticcacaulis solisilvae TaxID=1217274 RepID=UPI003FD8C1EE
MKNPFISHLRSSEGLRKSRLLAAGGSDRWPAKLLKKRLIQGLAARSERDYIQRSTDSEGLCKGCPLSNPAGFSFSIFCFRRFKRPCGKKKKIG